MVNKPAWAPPTLGQGAVGCGQGTKKRASGLMRHACRKFVSQRRNCKARCGRPRQLVKTGASFSRERLGEHVFAPDHADRFQQSRHRSTATVKKRAGQKEMSGSKPCVSVSHLPFDVVSNRCKAFEGNLKLQGRDKHACQRAHKYWELKQANHGRGESRKQEGNPLPGTSSHNRRT